MSKILEMCKQMPEFSIEQCSCKDLKGKERNYEKLKFPFFCISVLKKLQRPVNGLYIMLSNDKQFFIYFKTAGARNLPMRSPAKSMILKHN